MRRVLKSVIAAGVVALAGFFWLDGIEGVAPRVTAQQRVDFKRDIQPIFEESCYSCHGPKKALGQLRLDRKQAAMDGGISGNVIVPGNGSGSRLTQRLLGAGGEVRMPLGGELSHPQIELIRVWIDQGAIWPDDAVSRAMEAPTHWAYLKPSRPAAPVVRNSGWVRNSIDGFVLSRLEKEGLIPSAEAERGKLLRRVYLDLIGLPPSPQELSAFLNDRGEDAYQRVIDRLLVSQHFGERWARHWLDLARYADSNGYEKDSLRVMWKYRDWVIDAFNQDKPFDQFTIEQIAGDMLPNATLDQRVATGFHRNTLLNQEGGIDPEEARFDTIVDRVNTTATVWLGSTLGCAQCHNHKYDPFSQKDYYRFYAFFEGAEYRNEGTSFDRYVKEPDLLLPTAEQEQVRLEIEREIKSLNETLKKSTPQLDEAQREWEKTNLEYQRQWLPLDLLSLRSTGGTVLKKQIDRSILATGPNPEIETYILTGTTKIKAIKAIKAIRIEALTDARLPQSGPGRDPYGNFLLTGLEASVAPRHRPQRMRSITFKDASVDEAAVRFDPVKFFDRPRFNPAMDSPTGWYINATRDVVRYNRQAVFTFSEAQGSPSGLAVRIRLKFEGGSLGQGIGRLRVSVSADPTPQAITALPARLRPILYIPEVKRTQQQREELSTQYRSVAPLLKTERDRLRMLNQRLASLGIVGALVMKERESAEPLSTFLRERGNFSSLGERVTAAVPSMLHTIPDDQPLNRLGLARWLVSNENPLVARVVVNRIWEQMFGKGIVETSEDFGLQGSPPSHPELLEWLATELMQQKWSVKALLRTIVTSSTYRQTSNVARALEERDPYNRLLARGPRFRIEAEMVRDVALAASGLLSHKVGGPSVYPWQPEGIWRNPYSGARWVVSSGEDRYRRSLYTFLRRTSPYPSMTAFDATSRETCTVRRIRTNTPLQALTVLNDEGFFELARGLARRMIAEGGPSLKDRIGFGFQVCTSRSAKSAEIDRLTQLYEAQLRRFSADAAAAKKLLKNNGISNQPMETAEMAELAAYTIVANVLLNLDETLNKE